MVPPGVTKMETLEQCRERVAAAVRGLTAEQVNAVAQHHHDSGESVWHSVHVVLETPQCQCVPCKRARA